MKLNGKTLQSIRNAMQDAFNEDDFDILVSDADIGLDYSHFKGTYPTKIMKLVEDAALADTLAPLLRLAIERRPLNQLLKDAVENFEQECPPTQPTFRTKSDKPTSLSPDRPVPSLVRHNPESGIFQQRPSELPTLAMRLRWLITGAVFGIAAAVPLGMLIHDNLRRRDELRTDASSELFKAIELRKDVDQPGEWKYFFGTNGAEVASQLSAFGPDPKDVRATIAGGKSIHVWYRGKDVGCRYHFIEAAFGGPSRTERDKIFDRSGEFIPLGFSGVSADYFSYLDVQRGGSLITADVDSTEADRAIYIDTPIPAHNGIKYDYNLTVDFTVFRGNSTIYKPTDPRVQTPKYIATIRRETDKLTISPIQNPEKLDPNAREFETPDKKVQIRITGILFSQPRKHKISLSWNSHPDGPTGEVLEKIKDPRNYHIYARP